MHAFLAKLLVSGLCVCFVFGLLPEIYRLIYSLIMVLVCRKRCEQVPSRNRNTDKKDIGRHHGTTPDCSSGESDDRHHRRSKDDGRQHRKHGRSQKHADNVDAPEEKHSKKYDRKSSNSVDSDSAKDHSDQGRRAGSKYDHSKQTDETDRKHHELNRQETVSSKKRRQSDSVEVHASSRKSELNSPVSCTTSDDGNSKQKQARTELDTPAVQSKTAKQTVGTALENARARYLARKGKSSTPVICDDSE